MNPTDRSILMQKAKHTYDRNEYIRFLFQKERNMAELGRKFKVSRQAIWKILREARSEG